MKTSLILVFIIKYVVYIIVIYLHSFYKNFIVRALRLKFFQK